MAVNKFTDVLTTGEIEGTGSFDVLMRATKEHLKGEFDAGRIRGTDYANAYVQATSAVLAQATQYSISQSRLAAELELMEAQTLQVKQETQTSAAQEELLAAQISHTTKQELQTVQETKNLVTQELQTKAQTKGIEAQTAISDYQLANILPKELEQITAQVSMTSKQEEGITKDNLIKDFQLSDVLPKEIEQTTAQIALVTKQSEGITTDNLIKDYQLSNVLPAEVTNLTKQGLQLAAQTGLTEQQVTNLSTENEQSKAQHILELQSIEAQIAKITTDTVVATKQAALVDAQAIGEQARTQNTEASTRQSDYETNFLLPAQLVTAEEQAALVTKQIEQTNQQTLNMAAEKERIMKQTAQLAAETALRDVELEMQQFNRDYKQAVELELMQKDAELREKQISISDKEVLLKQAQIDLSTKEIAVKQSQLELSEKELLVKQAQVDLSAKEVLLKSEQISLTKYELTNKLPAEVALLEAQNSLYTQKTITETAQTDNSVVGLNSVTDINNKLILEQSKTYLRTFQQNTAKMMIDTWNVRHTADPDGNLENSANKLMDVNIGRVLDKLATELGITLT